MRGLRKIKQLFPIDFFFTRIVIKNMSINKFLLGAGFKAEGMTI